MSFFPHPVGLLGGAAPAELSFVGFTEITTDLADYTFASVNIGAADPTRRVVVAIHWADSAVTTTLENSVTIQGIAATIHVQADGGTSNCAIVSALVPTGTTADIVFGTVSNTPVDRAAIGVYRAINESVATPHDTAVDLTASSGVLSDTINIPANGWVVGAANFSNAVSPTADTWVGVTEQYGHPTPGAPSDAAGQFRSGGFASGLPLEANRTLSCTLTAGAPLPNGRLAGVSWG